MLSQGALALHLQLWDKIRAQDTNIKWVLKRSCISIATIKKYKWLEESERILISSSWKKKIQRLILCFESDKSVLHWPITIMFRTHKKITKPQTYYHFHLWLSFLMPNWVFPLSTKAFIIISDVYSFWILPFWTQKK